MRYQAALITDWTEQDSSKSAAQMHGGDRRISKPGSLRHGFFQDMHQITMEKQVPPPWAFRQEIDPPWASTYCLASASPIPLPRG